MCGKLLAKYKRVFKNAGKHHRSSFSGKTSRRPNLTTEEFPVIYPVLTKALAELSENPVLEATMIHLRWPR